jgi:hypothetical protein
MGLSITGIIVDIPEGIHTTGVVEFKRLEEPLKPSQLWVVHGACLEELGAIGKDSPPCVPLNRHQVGIHVDNPVISSATRRMLEILVESPAQVTARIISSRHASLWTQETYPSFATLRP